MGSFFLYSLSKGRSASAYHTRSTQEWRHAAGSWAAGAAQSQRKWTRRPHRRPAPQPRTVAATAAAQPQGAPRPTQIELQKRINAQLCEARSVHEVLAVLAAHSCEEMGDISAVTAFHRLAKHARSPQERAEAQRSPLLAPLVAHLERGGMQWSAMAVANVLWAHSVLGHASRALVRKAFRQLDFVRVEESASCFHALVLALAKLGLPHAGYLRRLNAALVEEAAAEAAAARQQRQLGAQGVQGSPAQAAGPLRPGGASNGSGEADGRAPAAAAGEEAGQAVQRSLLGRLSTQQLCLFAHSLASLGCTDGRGLWLCLDEAARRDLAGLSVRSLCQLTRAMVLGSVYNSAACDAVAAAVARLPEAALDGESCSRLLHDYGLVYQKHLVGKGLDPHRRAQWQEAVRELVRADPARRAMLGRLAQRALQQVGAMGPVSLSSLVWGLASLGQREGPLLDAVAAEAMALGTRLDAQAVASICWAFAALSHDHPPLMERVAGITLELLSDPARRGEFNSQTVPMLALSFAVLNRCESTAAQAMLAALAGRAEELLPELTTQGLSNLGWGLAVGQAFTPRLAHAWRAAVVGRLQEFSPLELNQCHQVEVALQLEVPQLPQGQGGGGGGVTEPAPRAVAGGASPLASYDVLLESLYQSGRLRSVAKRGWERGQQWGKRNVTRWQQQIYDLLCALGVECELEFLGAGGEFSADIALPAQRVAVECDGPWHYMANSRHQEGGTALKHRLLRALGWTVVPIPFFAWPDKREEQVEYLRRALAEVGVPLPADAIAADESLPRPQRPQRRQQMQQRQRGGAKQGAQRRLWRQQQLEGDAERAAEPAADVSAEGSAPPVAASGASQESIEQAASALEAGPALPDAGGEAQEASQAEEQAGAVEERGRRLAMLRYKSGKLSKTQLIVRQRAGAGPAEADEGGGG